MENKESQPNMDEENIYEKTFLKPFIHEKRQPPQWIVEGLIPLGYLITVEGMSSSGKSLFVNDLAIAVIYDKPFLNRKVKGGDVLIIDQDTPIDALNIRLDKFMNYYKEKPKYELYVESMQGYQISSNKPEYLLENMINRYTNVKLIIIDCLHSISGKLDVNSTSDMVKLSELKSKVLRKDLTIILVHHISEHSEMIINEMMTTADINKFSMGSSVINQQSDAIILLGSNDRNILRTLYLRPIGKRITLRFPKCIVRLKESKKEKYMHFFYCCEYQFIEEVDLDVIQLFKALGKTEPLGAVQIYEKMNGTYGICCLRQSLKRLVHQKVLILRKCKHNLFRYELNKKRFRKMKNLHTQTLSFLSNWTTQLRR